MEGTVLLRQRLMEKDLLMASSIRRYGMNSLLATILYLQTPNYLKKITLWSKENYHCSLLMFAICSVRRIYNNEKINCMELIIPGRDT
jgi:hypothetical protein